MSVLKRLGGRLPDFGDVVKRFPVATIIMAVFTLWIIYQNFQSWQSDREYVFGGFVLAGYVAVLIKLVGEVRGWSTLKIILAQALACGVSFLLSMFGKTLGFNIPMAIAAAILFLGNASAWRRSREDMRVWTFTQKLWTGAIFATVGSIIFVAGIFAITSAIRILFDLRIDDLTEDIILPIGLAFLAPLYWMGTLPSVDESEEIGEMSFEARALSFLGTWMLAPLLCIYALILLAYGVKILVQWDLPKGEIAALVTPFLGIGMLVWLMLTPELLNRNGFVRFFRRAWHWVMIPAAILLGIAVIVRVREYGFTIERVFLLLVFIWAMVQGLWFTVLPVVRRDIRVPTALAAGLLVIGALGSEWLSVRSQFNRAMDAKRELPSFSAEAMKANPEIAKQFLGGAEYLIRLQNEAKFKALFPDYEMPNNVYGSDWRDLKEEFGLDDIEGETAPYRVPYNFRTVTPVSLPANSQLYIANNINLLMDEKRSSDLDFVSGWEDFEVTFEVQDETWVVDLKPIFEAMDRVGANDADVPIVTKPIEITSASGQSAQLLITGGYMAFYREEGLRDARIDLMLITPN